MSNTNNAQQITPLSSPDQENSNSELNNDDKLDEEQQHPDLSTIPKTTPAIVRAKQLRSFFQSPTDNVMSPFSQTFAGKGGHLHHPALLKQKPKRLNEQPVYKK